MTPTTQRQQLEQFMNANPPSFISNMQDRIINDLKNQQEQVFIEALKRHGIEIEDKLVLEEFVESNVNCEDNVYLKRKTYFVNSVPFLVHDYEPIVDLKPITLERETKFSANLGTYQFV
jgi:hypothetical protein